MTDIEKRLGEIRERVAMATDGPWAWDGDVSNYDSDNEAPWLVSADEKIILLGTIKSNIKEDADFIAHARTDIPFLLAQLESARREVIQKTNRVLYLEDIMQDVERRARSLLACTYVRKQPPAPQPQEEEK